MHVASHSIFCLLLRGQREFWLAQAPSISGLGRSKHQLKLRDTSRLGKQGKQTEAINPKMCTTAYQHCAWVWTCTFAGSINAGRLQHEPDEHCALHDSTATASLFQKHARHSLFLINGHQKVRFDIAICHFRSGTSSLCAGSKTCRHVVLGG